MRCRLLVLAVAAALLAPLFAACSSSPGSSDRPSSPSATVNAVHGPMFPECGGVSDQTVAQLTAMRGLLNTARNSVGCRWGAGRGVLWPRFSFTWFRGSPIGRERKGDALTRTRVDDINLDGHNGFIAVRTDPRLGDSQCTVGIQYQDDFFEWSINFNQQPFPDPCGIAKELSRQSIAAAK